jgi:hypothetical protein
MPHAPHCQWIGVAPHIAKWVGDPTRAWEMLAPKQTHEALSMAAFTAPGPQQAGTIRFVCVSDTHGAASMPVIPDGDVLLHAGDWTQTGRLSEVAALCEWLKSQKHARKICVAGNHDLTMDGSSLGETARRFGLVCSDLADGELEQLSATARQMVESSCALRAGAWQLAHAMSSDRTFSRPGEYLCDSGTTVRGIHVWGSPWQVRPHRPSPDA